MAKCQFVPNYLETSQEIDHMLCCCHHKGTVPLEAHRSAPTSRRPHGRELLSSHAQVIINHHHAAPRRLLCRPRLRRFPAPPARASSTAGRAAAPTARPLVSVDRLLLDPVQKFNMHQCATTGRRETRSIFCKTHLQDTLHRSHHRAPCLGKPLL